VVMEPPPPPPPPSPPPPPPPPAPAKTATVESKPVAQRPPIPVMPADRSVIVASQAKVIKFEWRPRGHAHTYEISVRSLDSDFTKTISSERSTAKLAEIPNGRYSWSIRPVDVNGKRGPRSALRTFVIKPDPIAKSAAPAPDLSVQKPVLLPAVIERRPAGH
jgi:hypothetical protein